MTQPDGTPQSPAPPSFAPASRAGAAKAHSRTASSSSQPQSFAPAQPLKPARSRGSAGTGNGDRGATAAPPSFEPARGHAPATRSTQGSTSHAAPAPARPGPPARKANAAAQPPSPRKPRRKRHRLLKALAVILAVIVVALAALVGWVNANLNKEPWLTSTADNSSAQSWLILGSDERDGTTGQDGTTGARTDTILVLTKPKSGPSSLISIPRDSLVSVDGAYMKINAVMSLYGRSALVGEVEDITGYKIDHVAELSFGGLKDVVDALGGVTLCYDSDVNDEKSDLTWTAGCHTADGTTALAFSRMRYSDPNGDFGRAERQRQVIGAIVKKAFSPSTLFNFPKIKKVADATLDSLYVDEKTNAFTLMQMALAFQSASGSGGITGSLYWTDPGYYVDGVGSCVLLDDAQNTQLFKELNEGTHEAGTVGTLAES